MFDLQQIAESEGRQSEAKVWSVLVGQIWAGLTGYCYAPTDLQEVRLSNLLIHNADSGRLGTEPSFFSAPFAVVVFRN